MRKKKFRFPVTTLAGSSVKNIKAVVNGFKIHPNYRYKFMLTKILALLLEPLNMLESVIWNKKIKNFKINEPPIFIVGFWRSGTTLLHNLLCQDPRSAYTCTFQTVFPNILLSQSWWLKPIVNIFLPKKRPYDNVSMDMDFPQEEDFGMMNIQPHTIYKFFLFPEDMEKIIRDELFTSKLPVNSVEHWKNTYLSMIAKAILNTKGKRYIGKNPCHLARIDLLLKMFPDAKFIFIHRHPYLVIESLYQFILSVFEGVKLQKIPPTFSREIIVNLYKTMMDQYFIEKGKIPRQNLFEISLEQFSKDIHGNLCQIYKQFELGNYQEIKFLTENYLLKFPAPARKAVPPTNETIDLVNKYLTEIAGKLGYFIDN